MRPSIRPFLVAIGVTAIVAACSGSATPQPSAAVPSPSPAASPNPSAAPSASAAAATVMVAESTLGQILVDGAGRTLYAFTADTAGESTCYDACAGTWPALVVSGEISVGAGLDAGDFSTTTRTDGTTQVKVGGWPLYYFAPDTASGDTKGQGVNQVWWVVSPSGELIKG